MNNRTLAYLAGVVVLLALGVLIVRRASKSAPPLRLGPERLADKADRLEVGGPSGQFSFSRSSSAWNMQAPLAYPADSDAIARLMAQLSQAQISEALSSDPARYPLFGLSDSSATRVRVASSKAEFQPVEFYLGKGGADEDTAFVRFPGRPDVVQAQGLTAGAFTKTLGDWLDKTLCPRLGSLQTLNIRDGKSKVALQAENGHWRSMGAKAEISTAAAAQMVAPAIEALRDLTADRLIPAQNAPAAETRGLAHPELVIEARGAGGQCALEAGKKDASGQRYVARAGETQVYFQIYDWRFDSLRKKELLSLR